MNFFTRLFKRAAQALPGALPPATGVTLDSRTLKGWGNALRIGKELSSNTYEIDGHLTPIPDVGDDVLAQSQGGQIGRFRIIEIRGCGDPHDMFFGKMKFVSLETK